jgi:hypothetical protein
MVAQKCKYLLFIININYLIIVYDRAIISVDNIDPITGIHVDKL